MPRVLVEACTDTIESALAAYQGGARRIELCANLIEGGTTPSAGTLLECRERLDIPIHALIRPRGGDFVYTDAEVRVMVRDIETVRDIGIDGIVIGCLAPDGHVATDHLRTFCDAAGPLSVTFHRAFDMLRDWKGALDLLVEFAIDRVLTSGQARDAVAGTPMIAAMMEYAAGRIGILPGGGITALNVVQLVRATGASEVHLTGAVTIESTMAYRAPEVEIGNAPPRSEYEWSQTAAAVIREVVTNLDA